MDYWFTNQPKSDHRVTDSTEERRGSPAVTEQKGEKMSDRFLEVRLYCEHVKGGERPKAVKFLQMTVPSAQALNKIKRISCEEATKII
jgi:hypothetical protein